MQQLRDVLSLLEEGVADLAALRLLAALCTNNPAASPSPASLTTPLSPNGNGGPLSPSPLNDMNSLTRSLRSDIWLGGKMFDKVFAALVRLLDADQVREVCGSRVSTVLFAANVSYQEPEILEHGLVVIWEMLEHQAPYIDGHESEIYNLIFRLRYANRVHVRPRVQIRQFVTLSPLDFRSWRERPRFATCLRVASILSSA